MLLIPNNIKLTDNINLDPHIIVDVDESSVNA